MSTDEKQAAPAAKDSNSASGDAEKPKDAGKTQEDKREPQADAQGDENELYGATLLTQDAVDRADLFANESRTLDAASKIFGLQTNQQINFLASSGPEAPPYQTTPLSADTLARVRSGFVRSDDYPPLRNRLLDENLVILHGEPGSGREHLAIHILDALCDGHVDHLSAGTLSDLDPSAVVEDAGYLWTDITGVTSGAMGIAQAERLAAALRERHASMVIVWPASAQWPFQLDGLRYSLKHSLDLTTVMRSYLHAVADGPGATTSDLLSDPRVVEAQNGLAGAAEAAQLGLALQEVVLGRCSLDDALARAQGATTDWFAKLPEREDRAFALSLAALDGLSYPTVVAGARELDELIQQAEDPEHRSFIRATGRPTRQLLAAVEAIKVPALSTTSYGDVPVMSVSSKRKNYSREMLHSLWHDYPYLQELYLEWLTGLVGNTDAYVRDRAAVATGLLAQDDFDFVRGRILDDWACSEHREVRRAAGVALRAPVLSDELRDIVWKLLDEWARTDGPVRSPQYFRRMAAATALGGPVGATDCGRALAIITQRLLDWQLEQYSWRLWTVTMTAVVDLFGDGRHPQSTTVLEQMVEWADSREVGPHNLAVGAVVGILARPPAEGYRDHRRLAPALRAVETGPQNLDRMAHLWRLAFNDTLMSQASMDVLLRLAEHVDETSGEGLLVDLVAKLPETERERRSLRYEVRQWTAEDPHPLVLNRLVDVLNSLEVTR